MTAGAPITKITNYATKAFDADLYVMGHVHKAISHVASMLYLNSLGHFCTKTKAYLVVPAYIKAYQVGRKDDYAERGIMPPTLPNHCYFKLKLFTGQNNDGKEISVVIQ